METTKHAYGNFINYRSQSNHCITGLLSYVDSPIKNASEIVVVDYPRHGKSPGDPLRVAESSIPDFIESSESSFGKVILIEDIQARLINYLGAALDIDPLFFAGHCATEFYRIEKAPLPPYLASLPSQLAERGYLHIHYQRALDIGNTDEFSDYAYALKTDANIPRNIRRLPSLAGRQLALVRGCCSIFLKRLPDSWICLILTDPPPRVVMENQKSGGSKVFVGQPLQGGFEDFTQPVSFSKFDCGDSWDKTSMLGSLLHYLRTHPPGFIGSDPTILSLGYYPLRIFLGEWLLYACLMSRYLKYYEYSLRNVRDQFHDLDIIDLQRWRRRGKQSQQKLAQVRGFIHYWLDKEQDRKPWDAVIGDINYLEAQIKDFGQSMELMIPVATSIAQLLDARQSMRQTSNITRLTYIALIFVPLSWVCGLFSMSEKFSPGQEYFWVYFATALPLLFVVLFLSAFPDKKLEGGLERVWDMATWVQQYWKRDDTQSRIRGLGSTV